MSWSFTAIGKPAAVAKAARAAIDNPNNGCAGEPETTARAKTLEHIAAIADATIGDTCLNTTASGSMWRDGDTVKSHSVQISVQPLYGYVE